MRKGGWTYIMTNKPRGVLYIGVTAELASRVEQHRRGQGSAFCRRYNCTRLVHAEEHATIEEAIGREKALKAWKRDWKVELIETGNPEWRDLIEGGALTSRDPSVRWDDDWGWMEAGQFGNPSFTSGATSRSTTVSLPGSRASASTALTSSISLPPVSILRSRNLRPVTRTRPSKLLTNLL
jgi:putative endonuclease